MAEKNKRPGKGELHYIDTRKKLQLMKSILMFSISAIIFLVGLFLNHMDKKNLFTMIAILSVLPAAKMLVSYLVFLPYRSVPKEVYDSMIDSAKREDIFYTDVVFTSNEKIMFLSFMIIAGDHVIGLIGRNKENAEYISQYLNASMKEKSFLFTVEIYTLEDKFKKRLQEINRNMEKKINITEVNEFLRSLFV